MGRIGKEVGLAQKRSGYSCKMSRQAHFRITAMFLIRGAAACPARDNHRAIVPYSEELLRLSASELSMGRSGSGV